MPELLGWWTYVVGVPLSVGAFLTLFSLGGKGKHSARSARKAPKMGRSSPAKPQGHLKTAAPKTVVKTSVAKAAKRQTRAAELPPLFLLQNLLLIWSLMALAAAPFQPQRAAPLALALILGAITAGSAVLLVACAGLFVRFTPVDESSISLKSDLQGRIGECDATIDYGRGSLLVRDEFGTQHHLAARSDEPIARGEAVLLIEYQPGGDYFQVRRWTA